MLFSAIDQHESVIGIHTFSLSWTSLPLPPIPLFQVITEHQIQQITISYIMGLPGSSDGKESACNAGDLVGALGWSPGFEPWVRKICWRREWPPTPVFSLGNPWTVETGGLQSICFTHGNVYMSMFLSHPLLSSLRTDLHREQTCECN